ncbi:MAG TPA: isoprenylcysteine carboxylmethyltransferase family protein [Aestuariivirga sp.]|jgi:methyltransferase
MTLATLVLAFVSIQRLSELALARHNTKRLLAIGAYESDHEHYPLIVSLHVAWLASLWIYGRGAEVNLYWLSVFAILQILRVWIIATLGVRWTTRIIILPGAPVIATGPYKWLRHPNYVVVVAEIAVLPLALELPYLAVAFSILNACILTVRIRAENRALVAEA